MTNTKQIGVICSFCTKTFKHQCILDVHIVSHTKEKPHKCSVCSAAFGLAGGLKSHIKSVHEGIKLYKPKSSHCPVCGCKCRNCNMKSHMQTHSAELLFSCINSGCDFKTKSEHNLKAHVRRNHSLKRPFECPSDGCNYKAKCAERLKQHLKIHSQEKPFTCTAPGCSYACKIKSYLAVHYRKVHSEEKPYKCPTCDFRGKHKSSVIEHQRKHKRTKEVFECKASNCDYTTSYKSNSDHHFDAKHRKKNVSCTESGCNVKCGSIRLLKIHLRKSHTKTILQCPGDSCNFSTRFKCSLVVHISRFHQGLQSVPTVATRKFNVETAGEVDASLKCHFQNCGYQAKSTQHYGHHIATHNEEENRNHVCTLCFCRFRYLAELQSHVQKHVREKPYRCSFCEYTTAYTINLRDHARNIHRIFVIRRRKEDQVGKCRTCSKHFWSNTELVVHSMSHLQPVVVLERLNLKIM